MWTLKEDWVLFLVDEHKEGKKLYNLISGFACFTTTNTSRPGDFEHQPKHLVEQPGELMVVQKDDHNIGLHPYYGSTSIQPKMEGSDFESNTSQFTTGSLNQPSPTKRRSHIWLNGSCTSQQSFLICTWSFIVGILMLIYWWYSINLLSIYHIYTHIIQLIYYWYIAGLMWIYYKYTIAYITTYMYYIAWVGSCIEDGNQVPRVVPSLGARVHHCY